MMKMLILALALLVFAGCQPVGVTDVNLDSPAPETTPTGADLEAGTLRGSVSFPSQGIPDNLTVCADPLGTDAPTCTTTLIDGDFTYGKGYELQLPPGDYLVFAYVPGGQIATKAYYSEFVTCGLQAECPSHQPIVVTVSPGEEQEAVDPGDWYAPPEECWNRVLDTEEGLYWSGGCKGNALTPEMFCTEALVSLSPEEETAYQSWVRQGKVIDLRCQ